MYPPFLAMPFFRLQRSAYMNKLAFLYPLRPKASPGGKEAKMEFTYKSVTGNITIDVDESWVNILKDLDREEENNDHKERRRHYHFEACEYEGDDYGIDDEALEQLLETEAARQTVLPMLTKLTPAQRDVIDALFYRGLTLAEYARRKGFAKASVLDAKRAAIKKMKKIMETT